MQPISPQYFVKKLPVSCQMATSSHFNTTPGKNALRNLLESEVIKEAGFCFQILSQYSTQSPSEYHPECQQVASTQPTVLSCLSQRIQIRCFPDHPIPLASRESSCHHYKPLMENVAGFCGGDQPPWRNHPMISSVLNYSVSWTPMFLPVKLVPFLPFPSSTGEMGNKFLIQ